VRHFSKQHCTHFHLKIEPLIPPFFCSENPLGGTGVSPVLTHAESRGGVDTFMVLGVPWEHEWLVPWLCLGTTPSLPLKGEADGEGRIRKNL